MSHATKVNTAGYLFMIQDIRLVGAKMTPIQDIMVYFPKTNAAFGDFSKPEVPYQKNPEGTISFMHGESYPNIQQVQVRNKSVQDALAAGLIPIGGKIDEMFIEYSGSVYVKDVPSPDPDGAPIRKIGSITNVNCSGIVYQGDKIGLGFDEYDRNENVAPTTF